MIKRKHILFIVSRLPINLETGDRVRVYNFIKELTERGHRVDILGFVPSEEFSIQTDIEEICNRCIGIVKQGIEFRNPSRFKQIVNFIGSFFHKYPFRVWQWHNEVFINQAKNLIKKAHYDVIHFSEVVSGLVFDALSKENTSPKFVVDLVDSVALTVESSEKSNWLLWPFRFIEKKRLKKYELWLAAKADDVILISNRDKDYLGINKISIIPNGVTDTRKKDFKRDLDLLFTGNMAGEPNIDAVRWFAINVIPELPDVKFYIVGANPSQKVRSLESSQIRVIGFVEDIDEFYQRAKLFICPIRLGAGQKNKILEAMINHTPVISTTEGNMGVDAPESTIVIANSHEEFADKIQRLLQDEKHRKVLGENGYAYVKNNFSWQKSVDLLEQIYEK